MTKSTIDPTHTSWRPQGGCCHILKQFKVFKIDFEFGQSGCIGIVEGNVWNPFLMGCNFNVFKPMPRNQVVVSQLPRTDSKLYKIEM